MHDYIHLYLKDNGFVLDRCKGKWYLYKKSIVSVESIFELDIIVDDNFISAYSKHKDNIGEINKDNIIRSYCIDNFNELKFVFESNTSFYMFFKNSKLFQLP